MLRCAPNAEWAHSLTRTGAAAGMSPLVKHLLAWGCWWEYSRARPRSATSFQGTASRVLAFPSTCSRTSRLHTSLASKIAASKRGLGQIPGACTRCQQQGWKSCGFEEWPGRHLRSRSARRQAVALVVGSQPEDVPRQHQQQRQRQGRKKGWSAVAAVASKKQLAAVELADTPVPRRNGYDTGATGEIRLKHSSRRRSRDWEGAPAVGPQPNLAEPASVEGDDSDDIAPTCGGRAADETVGGWLRLTEREAATLRRKNPSFSKEDRWRAVLARRLHDHEQQGHVVNVLRDAPLRFGREDCRKIMMKHVDMLTMGGVSPAARLTWMQENLGLTDEEQLRALILKQPRLLSNGVDVNMAPVVKFLTEELGLPVLKVGAIVRKFPEVLNLSVDRTLAVKVRWFEETLGMDRRDVVRMITNLPCLFGYSIEDNMEPKISWIQQALAASRPTALSMITKWPGLFTCSVERNLQPTLDFFHEDLDGHPDEVREAVILNPRLLGASIEKRMRPRAAMMREAGIVATFAQHRWMLATKTDALFADYLEKLDGKPRRDVCVAAPSAPER